MHALTVKQPYAGDIITGSKPYEFRNFRPTITEFALHAGATPCLQHAGPYGAILGIVRIVDIVPATQVTSDPALLAYGKWAWRLEVVEVFDEPIPARGRPGFWKWERPLQWERSEDYCPACGSPNAAYTDPSDDPIHAGWECRDCDQYPPRQHAMYWWDNVGSDNPRHDSDD